jgi:hypothetical protein
MSTTNQQAAASLAHPRAVSPAFCFVGYVFFCIGSCFPFSSLQRSKISTQTTAK